MIQKREDDKKVGENGGEEKATRRKRDGMCWVVSQMNVSCHAPHSAVPSISVRREKGKDEEEPWNRIQHNTQKRRKKKVTTDRYVLTIKNVNN